MRQESASERSAVLPSACGLSALGTSLRMTMTSQSQPKPESADVGVVVPLPVSRAQRVWLDRAAEIIDAQKNLGAAAQRAAAEMRALSDEWLALADDTNTEEQA